MLAGANDFKLSVYVCRRGISKCLTKDKEYLGNEYVLGGTNYVFLRDDRGRLWEYPASWFVRKPGTDTYGLLSCMRR